MKRLFLWVSDFKSSMKIKINEKAKIEWIPKESDADFIFEGCLEIRIKIYSLLRHWIHRSILNGEQSEQIEILLNHQRKR